MKRAFIVLPKSKVIAATYAESSSAPSKSPFDDISDLVDRYFYEFLNGHENKHTIYAHMLKKYGDPELAEQLTRAIIETIYEDQREMGYYP